MGRRWPGQDSAPLETLLPEHPRYGGQTCQGWHCSAGFVQSMAVFFRSGQPALALMQLLEVERRGGMCLEGVVMEADFS